MNTFLHKDVCGATAVSQPLSDLGEVSPASTGDSRGESEEGAVSYGHVDSMVEPEPTLRPGRHQRSDEGHQATIRIEGWLK